MSQSSARLAPGRPCRVSAGLIARRIDNRHPGCYSIPRKDTRLSLKPASEPRRDKLSFDDADAFRALCGEHGQGLKLVERQTGTSLHVRGNEITIEGPESDVEVAKEALSQLYGFARRGAALGSDDIVRAVRVLKADRSAELKDIFADTVLVPRRGRPIAPKGLSQKRYVDAVRRHDIVFAIGPAGTGKTYLAMALAIRMLLDKHVKRIVLTRPAVEAGERLGFLPGSMEDKVNPYLRPLYDALHEMMDFDRARALMEQQVIEVAPLAFMRGRTLNDSFVILDEAQNATSEQMRMFLTRLGFGSKAVVTGDITQSDLPSGTRSGLREARDILSDVEGINFSTFTEADVVRHPLVQEIIRAYERRDEDRETARRAAAAFSAGNRRPDGGAGGGEAAPPRSAAE
jgi:phosphate starvation-inducible protein PhoH and related proteins